MVTLANSFSLKAKRHSENNQQVLWTVGLLSVVADGCITTRLVYSKRNKELLDICPHVKGQQHGSHLSCLAFCSRDLLSPITDMAWNKKIRLWCRFHPVSNMKTNYNLTAERKSNKIFNYVLYIWPMFSSFFPSFLKLWNIKSIYFVHLEVIALWYFKKCQLRYINLSSTFILQRIFCLCSILMSS